MLILDFRHFDASRYYWMLLDIFLDLLDDRFRTFSGFFFIHFCLSLLLVVVVIKNHILDCKYLVTLFT